MSFEVYTYSPSEVILDISGYRITGFNSIRVSRNSPPFKMVKGIRGRNSRVRNRDTSCSITLDILQTALANDVLSDLIGLDLFSNSVRLNLSLTDALGNSKIESSNCYVENWPEVVYSDDLQFRRWVLTCLDTSVFIAGGNAKLGGNAFTDAVGGAASSIKEGISNAASSAQDAVGNLTGGT